MPLTDEELRKWATELEIVFPSAGVFVDFLRRHKADLRGLKLLGDDFEKIHSCLAHICKQGLLKTNHLAEVILHEWQGKQSSWTEKVLVLVGRRLKLALYRWAAAVAVVVGCIIAVSLLVQLQGDDGSHPFQVPVLALGVSFGLITMTIYRIRVAPRIRRVVLALFLPLFAQAALGSTIAALSIARMRSIIEPLEGLHEVALARRVGHGAVRWQENPVNSHYGTLLDEFRRSANMLRQGQSAGSHWEDVEEATLSDREIRPRKLAYHLNRTFQVMRADCEVMPIGAGYGVLGGPYEVGLDWFFRRRRDAVDGFEHTLWFNQRSGVWLASDAKVGQSHTPSTRLEEWLSYFPFRPEWQWLKLEISEMAASRRKRFGSESRVEVVNGGIQGGLLEYILDPIDMRGQALSDGKITCLNSENAPPICVNQVGHSDWSIVERKRYFRGEEILAVTTMSSPDYSDSKGHDPSLWTRAEEWVCQVDVHRRTMQLVTGICYRAIAMTPPLMLSTPCRVGESQGCTVSNFSPGPWSRGSNLLTLERLSFDLAELNSHQYERPDSP